MKVLVTGAKGFIGRHLVLTLREYGHEVYEYDINCGNLNEFTKKCEFVFHLAGVNRPDDGNFSGNYTSLQDLLEALDRNENSCPIVMSSSVQAELDNPYGISKKQAEDILNIYGAAKNIKTYIYRLCNVFGPGSKPNYNSVVATWCYNLSHNQMCQVDDPEKDITLLYIDDLIKSFMAMLKGETVVPDITKTTLGDLYSELMKIKFSVDSGNMLNAGNPFVSKLYSTYLYYLTFPLYGKETHEDKRGSFTELFKSDIAGQVSVNIIKPGMTKGGHYHFSKWEQFVVAQGQCRIDDTDIFTGIEKVYNVNGHDPKAIYMCPGHLHSITNVGNQDAIVVIYTNEVYNPKAPDTYTIKSIFC